MGDFLRLRGGLEFGQNQPKTGDKKAIFSTREPGAEKHVLYIHMRSLSDVLWIDRRHNGLPQNILLVRADLLPGFSAPAHAQKKVSVEGGFQLARAYAKTIF